MPGQVDQLSTLKSGELDKLENYKKIVFYSVWIVFLALSTSNDISTKMYLIRTNFGSFYASRCNPVSR